MSLWAICTYRKPNLNIGVLHETMDDQSFTSPQESNTNQVEGLDCVPMCWWKRVVIIWMHCFFFFSVRRSILQINTALPVRQVHRHPFSLTATRPHIPLLLDFRTRETENPIVPLWIKDLQRRQQRGRLSKRKRERLGQNARVQMSSLLKQGFPHFHVCVPPCHDTAL